MQLKNWNQQSQSATKNARKVSAKQHYLSVARYVAGQTTNLSSRYQKLRNIIVIILILHLSIIIVGSILFYHGNSIELNQYFYQIITIFFKSDKKTLLSVQWLQKSDNYNYTKSSNTKLSFRSLIIHLKNTLFNLFEDKSLLKSSNSLTELRRYSTKASNKLNDLICKIIFFIFYPVFRLKYFLNSFLSLTQNEGEFSLKYLYKILTSFYFIRKLCDEKLWKYSNVFFLKLYNLFLDFVNYLGITWFGIYLVLFLTGACCFGLFFFYYYEYKKRN